MGKMKPIDLVEEYQCSGCVSGGECYEEDSIGIGCAKHCAGTILSSVGTILLGFPVGFNRLGIARKTPISMFNDYESFLCEWGGYNKFNVPVWKHLDKNGNTLIRGLSPRNNSPFIHVIRGDCTGKIDCLEITQEQVDGMD